MQTIKINIEQAANGYEFTTGHKAIATISQDKRGAYSARFQMYATANNMRTLPDAVEFISDAITNHFDGLGLDVEFVAA